MDELVSKVVKVSDLLPNSSVYIDVLLNLLLDQPLEERLFALVDGFAFSNLGSLLIVGVMARVHALVCSKSA